MKVLDYVLRNGDDLAFTECFWKKCEPHQSEVRRYPLYVECLKLFAQGKSIGQIARETGVKQASVDAYTKFRQQPKLAHYLSLRLQLGEPKPGRVWLSLNNTSGHAVPLGPVVEVPTSIFSWKDVAAVLIQLKSLSPEMHVLSREYMFGFLVGMLIGDAAKSKEGGGHRRIGLVLSKKYGTNVKIGDFTCVCARHFGLRMHRTHDLHRPSHKPHGFYEWCSQASPLIDWIFNVVIGLEDGKLTTYDAVKMDWVAESPGEFRRGLVQGVAESDGSVSIASQTVEFWIGPNWDFFRKLLSTYGVRSFKCRDALAVTRSEIVRLGTIPPFSPILRTVRYEKFEKLLNARHIRHGTRVPLDVREFITRNARGSSVPELSAKVLDKYGVSLSFEAVQRWARKGMNSPASA